MITCFLEDTSLINIVNICMCTKNKLNSGKTMIIKIKKVKHKVLVVNKTNKIN
jgi:hypothetical protein